MQEHERVSAKLGKFRPSITLALKRVADDRRKASLPVYDFGLGEISGTLNPKIREAGEAAFRDEHTMYGDPAGLPELRQAVLSWLDLEPFYTIDNVMVTAGAKQSLVNIFMAICNPADIVLFDAAPWVSYQPLAHMAYASPIMVIPADRDKRHLKITPDDLRRNLRMRPHARLFLLNNPCNPTAQIYEADEVAELVHICVENKIYFVLDRLYWRILFDGRSFPGLPLDENTLPWIIQVDGMSKNFRRAGGLRIGWSVAPVDVTRAMVNLQSHYTSGPATPTQRAALAALTNHYDATLIEELQEKRDILLQEVVGTPHLKVWPSPGSFYSFWDVRACFGKKTPKGQILNHSDDVAAFLMSQEGVIVASGSSFMCDGYLRVCFTPEKEILRKGMQAAKRAFSLLV